MDEKHEHQRFIVSEIAAYQACDLHTNPDTLLSYISIALASTCVVMYFPRRRRYAYIEVETSPCSPGHLSTKQPLPPRPTHRPLHALKTHPRKARAPTIPIALIPPQRLSQMRRRQRPHITLLQAFLQRRILRNLLPDTLRSIHLVEVHARLLDVLVCRLVAVVFDVCARALEGLHEDGGGKGAVGEMGGCDGPFVADGEGAVDDGADEGFRVGCDGDDDGLGDGLGEGLVDELADGFALEADAAVVFVALLLERRHEFQEHSVVALVKLLLWSGDQTMGEHTAHAFAPLSVALRLSCRLPQQPCPSPRPYRRHPPPRTPRRLHPHHQPDSRHLRLSRPDLLLRC